MREEKVERRREEKRRRGNKNGEIIDTILSVLAGRKFKWQKERRAKLCLGYRAHRHKGGFSIKA